VEAETDTPEGGKQRESRGIAVGEAWEKLGPAARLGTSKGAPLLHSGREKARTAAQCGSRG